MIQDPPRLVDDGSDADLARALRAAQGDVLPSEGVGRVHAGLAAAGIVGAAASGAAGSSAIKSAVAWSVEALRATSVKIGLCALVIGGGAWIWHARTHEEARQVAPHGIAASSQPLPAAPAPIDEAPVSVPAPAVSESPLASAPRVLVAPSGRRPADATPSAAAPPSPREGALLLEARRVLETDPARAIALVRAHEQEFPRSQLAPERARIAAEAGARLGK